MTNHLEINHDERFPTLADAPIVEAILHWQAVATTGFFESDYLAALGTHFSQYEVHPQHNLTTGIQGSDKGIVINHSNVVQGARILRKNATGGLDLACQFSRNGVIFSKLTPYENWDAFLRIATEFWAYFCEVGKPVEISQLATRYISQIPISSALQSNQYIGSNCAPLSMLGLDANSFYHQDTMQLDNHPYGISVTRAAQESPDGKQSLVVDISAFTTNALTDLDNIDGHLADLRYIKNKVFFSVMKNPVSNFGGAIDV